MVTDTAEWANPAAAGPVSSRRDGQAQDSDSKPGNDLTVYSRALPDYDRRLRTSTPSDQKSRAARN